MYTVTVTGGTGGGNYAAGATVTLTATAAAGKQFRQWSFTPTVTFTGGTNASSATVKFTMPANAVTATAAYDDITPTITTSGATPLPAAKIGEAYTTTLTASSGGATVAWSLASGSSLPPGLTLSPAGVISGTPTTAGTYTFTIRATNGSASSTVTLTLTVSPGVGNEVVGEHAGSPLRAYAQNGVLYISGLTAGEQWSVYNLSGVLIYHNTATDDKATLALPTRGVYIVRSGNKAVKAGN